MNKITFIIVALGGFLYSVNVWSCPVCFDAAGESRYAYYAITIALTALPLALIGFLYYYCVSRNK